MMDTYFIGLLVLSLLKLSVGDGLGIMQPNGRLYKMQNDTIEITCTLTNQSYYTIDDLTFDLPKPSDNKARLNEIQHIESISRTERINETTKKFIINNAPIIEDLAVNCGVRNHQNEIIGINFLKIHVGLKPQNVIDFKCRSLNRKSLKCTFSHPYNPVTITYTLSYRITSNKSDLSDLQKSVYPNACTAFDRNETPPYEQYCIINGYRTYRFYVFELFGRNSLGNNTEFFVIEPDNLVIPDQPTDLIINQTSDSAKLSWIIPLDLQNIDRKIQYKIYYMCDYDNEMWKVSGPHNESDQHFRDRKYATIASTQIRQMSHTLSDLYAHTKYDLRVSIKVSSTENIDEFWSKNATHLFSTLSRRPDRPPRTDSGSFSLTDNNDVFIYWEELHKSEHNGDDFKYIIVDANNKEHALSGVWWWKLSNSSSFNLPKPLKFKIFSENKEGRSNASSIITIPNERCDPPINIKKFHEENLYNISWTRPKKLDQRITGYTVFWCEQNHSENENDCKGSVHFARVGSDVTTFELKTTKTMNIAISAETETSTSGMTWAKCTVGSGSEHTTFIKSFTTSPTNTSTSIRCQWGIECVQQMMSTKYQLKYCPIGDDVTKRKCKDGEEVILNITDVHETEYTIRNLRPYTTYLLSIRMVTDRKEGQWRDTEVTTNEDAPTPPLDLTYQNVTDTTVQLVWKQPEALNGKLNGYTIYYNNQTIASVHNTTYLLKNLSPFSGYNVFVIAHTIKPSGPSNSIQFNTTIGKPERMEAPNKKDDILLWEPPKRKGGYLDFYELYIVLDEKRRNVHEVRTVKIKNTKCTLTEPFINPPIFGSIEISVRAVNILHYDTNPNLRVKRDLSPDTEKTNGENYLIKPESKSVISSISKGFNLNTIEPSVKEFENIKNKEIDEERFQRFIYAFKHDGFCEEEQPHLGIINEAFGKIFEGEFSNSHTFEYNRPSEKHHNYFMLILLTILSMGLLYGVWFSTKKVKHWKNINPILPPGLEDIKDAKTKHVDAGITRNDVVHTIMTNHEENDPLVNIKHQTESTSSNSSDNNSQSEYNEGMDNSSEFEQTNDANGIQSMNDSPNIKSTPTSLIPMQDPIKMSSFAQSTPVYMHTPTVESHHSRDSHAPSDSQFNARPLPSSNPISPSTLPLTSNGYVKHEAILRKPVVSTGYTPLSAVEQAKPTIPIQIDEIKTKPSIITSNEIQGISGYVTQKQLSDFGQFQIH